jgi:hypothetical protein
VRLPDTIRVLRRAPLARDAYGTLTLLHAQVGDPSWDWRKPLVHLEPAPALSADAQLRDRFREALGRWMRVMHPHVVQVLDLAPDDPPYALLEYAYGPTLAELCRALSAAGRPLPAPVAALMISQLAEAHRALAAAGVAHGFWAGHIAVTRYGLQLVPRAWWDERATVDADRRLLEVLRKALLAHTGGRVPAAPPPVASPDELWTLAVELCGEPTPALEPA